MGEPVNNGIRTLNGSENWDRAGVTAAKSLGAPDECTAYAELAERSY